MGSEHKAADGQTAEGMVEGTKFVEEKNTFVPAYLPPLPRLSVIKDARCEMRKEEKTISTSAISHPLFLRGVCQWFGCETHCESIEEFLSHLCLHHRFSETSIAESNVQQELVGRLENQLEMERTRLAAMMEHLKLLSECQRNQREENLSIINSLQSQNHKNMFSLSEEDLLQKFKSSNNEGSQMYLNQREDRSSRPPQTYASLIRMVGNLKQYFL